MIDALVKATWKLVQMMAAVVRDNISANIAGVRIVEEKKSNISFMCYH